MRTRDSVEAGLMQSMIVVIRRSRSVSGCRYEAAALPRTARTDRIRWPVTSPSDTDIRPICCFTSFSSSVMYVYVPSGSFCTKYWPTRASNDRLTRASRAVASCPRSRRSSTTRFDGAHGKSFT